MGGSLKATVTAAVMNNPSPPPVSEKTAERGICGRFEVPTRKVLQ
jgi:hypothetical protein